jgi:hypothetical protein
MRRMLYLFSTGPRCFRKNKQNENQNNQAEIKKCGGGKRVGAGVV